MLAKVRCSTANNNTAAFIVVLTLSIAEPATQMDDNNNNNNNNKTLPEDLQMQHTSLFTASKTLGSERCMIDCFGYAFLIMGGHDATPGTCIEIEGKSSVGTTRQSTSYKLHKRQTPVTDFCTTRTLCHRRLFKRTHGPVFPPYLRNNEKPYQTHLETRPSNVCIFSVDMSC